MLSYPDATQPGCNTCTNNHMSQHSLGGHDVSTWHAIPWYRSAMERMQSRGARPTPGPNSHSPPGCSYPREHEHDTAALGSRMGITPSRATPCNTPTRLPRLSRVPPTDHPAGGRYRPPHTVCACCPSAPRPLPTIIPLPPVSASAAPPSLCPNSPHHHRRVQLAQHVRCCIPLPPPPALPRPQPPYAGTTFQLPTRGPPLLPPMGPPLLPPA